MKKSQCDICEHLKTDSSLIAKNVAQPNRFCSFKNISMNNLNPRSNCDSFHVSYFASPEEKYNAII